MSHAVMLLMRTGRKSEHIIISKIAGDLACVSRHDEKCRSYLLLVFLDDWRLGRVWGTGDQFGRSMQAPMASKTSIRLHATAAS